MADEEHRPIRPEAVEVEWDDEARETLPIQLPEVTLISPEEARALANNLDMALRYHVGLGPEDGRVLFDRADRETFREAVAAWGIGDQREMAEEECAEFIVASKHFARGKAPIGDVVDELADLRIMVEQLTEFFGRATVEDRVRYKMDRLRERLDEGDPPTGNNGGLS